MSIERSFSNLSRPRRRDRAVEDESWIKAFLGRAAAGVIATESEGQPFINSNLFVYDEPAGAIYFHTARTGRTRGNIDCASGDPSEGGARVCFHCFEMGRLLPADIAYEFSVEYAGVTVFGKAHVVSDKDEAEHGLQLLLDKYFPHLKAGQDYRSITEDELSRTSVYRIDIEEWSGKRKQVDEEFPGAFYYPGPVTSQQI